MRLWRITEDKLPSKIPVIISPEVESEISTIEDNNRDNDEMIAQWKDSLSAIINHISNPTIAWDNIGKFRHVANKETYATIFGHNIAYTIETDKTGRNYVDIFYFDLCPEEYGLNESIRKKSIVLTESDLRMMVQECIRRIITEESYKPIAHNKTIKLPNDVRVESLVTLSDGAGRFDIYEDDGCYVVRDRNLDGDKDYHPWYIFPELLSALKKLPNLPLR